MITVHLEMKMTIFTGCGVAVILLCVQGMWTRYRTHSDTHNTDRPAREKYKMYYCIVLLYC